MDDRTLLTFLAKAHKYKEVSDYGTGSGAFITQAEAVGAVADAEIFLSRVTERIQDR